MTTETETPITAYQETNGMIYFARMLDKVRKFASGTLREDFHQNIGISLDGRCCQFLRVSYEDLRTRTLEGGTDNEILDWCMANGRDLDENDLHIWNSFVKKLGWNDPVAEVLAKRKRSSSLENRDEIQTMIEYFEYDEGRKI
tara:strand:- start:14959 stop:15387 length:429 start_codon:yes stop_codon:yes gene_type:complete